MGLRAQMSGVYTVPGSFSSIATAIGSLNAVGVSGAVTINIQAGYTETILAGYSLTATGTSANPITFMKSGSGANPLITAHVGVGTPTSSMQDGIWSLIGSDYITIDRIDLYDGNTTNPATMEYGYGLLKASATDGCNNNTIKNCVVTLSRNNNALGAGPAADGSRGINLSNSTIATHTTALVITNVSGASSNNKFYGNTIQNCNVGIALIGYAAASPFTLADTGNDVGGSSAATGNTILNFGGGGTASPAIGIRTVAQYNFNASYNSIVNNSGGTGVNHAQVLKGISTSVATSANTSISNNTITLNGGGTTHQVAAIENASGSTAASNTIAITNNIIVACFYNTSTTGVFNAIINSGTAAQLSVTSNSVSYTTLSGTGNHVLIETGSPAIATVNSNTISGVGLTGVSGNCRVIKTTSPGTSFTANNNVIDSVVYTSTTSSGNVDAIFSNNNATAVTINNNIIRKLQLLGSGNVTGIRENGNAGIKSIMGNQIYNFKTIPAVVSTGGGTYIGIICTTGTIDISNNSIYGIEHTGSTGVTINGIQLSGGTVNNVYKNKITGLSSTGSAAVVAGLVGSSGTTYNIYNNLIGDFSAPAAVGANAMIGISLTGATTNNIYFNSVYLNAVSSGTLFGSSAISVNSSPTTISFKNNIFVNTSVPSGTGITAAFRKSSTSLTNYATTSNNNLFYAGTTGTNTAIFYDGTTVYQTLATFKAQMATRDGLSITENPPFVATTGTNSTFLNINPLVATQIESGAVPISGITDDYIGTTRNVSAPDIGAWEGNYLLNDIVPPTITGIGFITTACNTAARTLTVNLSDASGVASGGNAPKVYYKLNATTYTGTAGTLSSGTAQNGVWSFNLAFSASLGDVVSYYVVAQDVATTPNLAASPAAGFAGTDVNTVTTPPTTPPTYTISTALSGTYTVGSAGNYTTLTSAANAYNTSCLTGPVTFMLTNTLYSTAETFPITFNLNTDASATNSLLIRPSSTVAAVITGISSGSAVLKFLNARYITVDGINTPGSSLAMNSTNTGTSAVVWLASTATSGPGNNNIRIKNCALNGGSTALGSYGIAAAVNGTAVSATAGLDNDNITVSTNTIINVYYGVYVRGTAATSAGGADNWSVSNNIIGPVTAGGNSTGGSAIFVQAALNASVNSNTIRNLSTADSDIGGIYFKTNVNGSSISQNTITGISSSASSQDIDAIAGVYLGTGILSSTVSANTIMSVVNTNTSGYGSRGIIINTGSTANVSIQNNMISDIISYSDPDVEYWPVGIALEGSAGGISLDFNSVNLSGAHPGLTSSTGSAPLLLNNTGSVIARNNIFSNTYNNSASTGDIAYAVYLNGSTNNFSTIDYNDYYVGGTGNIPTLGSFSFTDFNTLAALQTNYGGNVNSKTITPVFTSATDLHLVGANNLLLDNSGTPLAGITLDIDSQVRSTTTPDMGADEFSVPSCTAASGGTVAPLSLNLCVGQAFTLNASGVSIGNSISYQWKVAPTSGGTYTNVSTGAGATTTSYVNSATVPGTYFMELQATCGSASLTGASNIVTITVNAAPTASATVASSLICAGSAINLSGSSDVGTTFNWYGPNSFTSAVQNPSIASAPAAASGNYTLVTALSICTTSAIVNVAVGPAPSALSVTPSSAAVCSNGSQALVVSGGAASGALVSGTQSATNTAGSFGSTDYPAPYTLFYGGQRMQMLILASELTAAGFANGSQFTNVQFPVVSKGSGWPGTVSRLQNFRVSLGLTNLSALTAFQTGLTIVQSAANFTPNVGYANTHNFSASSFTWDGVSNVILETTFSNNLTGNSNYAVIQYNSPTSFASCVVARADAQTAAAIATLSAVNYSYSSRPDFTLNGRGMGTYSWSPSTGLSSTTGVSVAVTPTVSQTYTVTFNNGCSTSTDVAVTIAPSPTLSITSLTAVCAGSSATLSAGGATSYTWNTTPTPTTDIVVSPTANTTYTLKGSVGSCTSAITRSIAVLALPTVSASASSTVVCSNGSVTLSGAGASTYTWSGGAVNGVPFAPGSITNYTVTGANAAGCTNTAVQTLSVNPSPTISFSGSSGICTGQTASIIASGADTYSWATGETTNSIVTIPSGSSTYTVTGTNTPGSCVTTATQFVSVSTTLSVSISGPTLICAGQAASLTAIGGVTYTWNTGATTSTLAPMPVINTTYSVIGASGTCSNTAVTTISVNASPTLSISGPTATCPNQSLALTAGGANTYTWSTSSTNSSISVSPSAPTTYTVRGTNGNNCTSSATVAVAINTVPVITIAGPGASVCINSPATFTASGAATYTWVNGPATATNTVTPASAAIYTVSGSSGAGCVSSKTIALGTYSLPVVTISPASPTICSLASQTLTASGAAALVWTGGPSTSTYVVNPSTTTTYSVTGTNTNNCSFTKTVTVVTNTLPVIAVVQSNTAVCAGASVTFTASGANTYTWNNSSQGASVLVYPSSNTVYTVTGKNAQNCISSATVAVSTLSAPALAIIPASSTVCPFVAATYTATGADSYTWTNSASSGSTAVFTSTALSSYSVTGSAVNGCTASISNVVFVYALPTIAVSASSQTVCSFAPVNFTATGADAYLWSDGTASDIITVNPLSSADVYTVTGTSALTGCSGTQTAAVIVNPLPVISITPASTVVCANTPVALSASGANSYLWSTNSINQSITVAPATTTVYAVSGTDGLGCTGTETVEITVNPLPVIIVSPSSLTICTNASATVTASGADSYSWIPGSATGNTFVAMPVASTVYTVSGTDANNCVGRALVSVDVTICNGIKTTAFSGNAVSVYPNPSTGVFTASFEFEGVKTIAIINSVGQLIMETTTAATSEMFNLSDVAKGVYFVKVSTKEASGNYKMIVE